MAKKRKGKMKTWPKNTQFYTYSHCTWCGEITKHSITYRVNQEKRTCTVCGVGKVV